MVYLNIVLSFQAEESFIKQKSCSEPQFFFFFFFFCFLGLHLQHMEVPRLGVQSEVQLRATAIATRDLSHICSLYHSSQKCRILNPLIKARDPACILMDTSRARYC